MLIMQDMSAPLEGTNMLDPNDSHDDSLRLAFGLFFLTEKELTFPSQLINTSLYTRFPKKPQEKVLHFYSLE